MKFIELKSYVMSEGPDAEELKAVVLISNCANYVDPQKGCPPKEQRRRIRILDALGDLAEDATVLELEDADMATLQELVERMPFGGVSRGILEFCDDVKNAKSVKDKRSKSADKAA